MKKITFVLLTYFSTIQLINAQQPMTIAPGLNISAPTAGTSGLKFNNLNSGTTVSTTPTKVLSLDATGNVILGNAASTWTSAGGVTSTAEPIVSGIFSTNAQLNLFKASTTDVSPMVRYTTGSTGGIVTRFGSTASAFEGTIYNTVVTGTLPADASVEWKHTSVNSSNGVITQTPMMTLTGGGNMSINGLKFNNLNSGTTVSTTPTKVLSLDATGNVILGNAASGGGGGGTSTWTSASGVTSTTEKVTIGGFTKLGNEVTTTTAGVTKSTPAIKTLMLTGSINVALATETSASLTTSVPHGLNADKILSVSIVLKPLVLRGSGNFELFVTPNYTDNRPSPGGTNGLEFVYMIGVTNIDIIRTNGNSGLLARTAIAGTNIPAYGAPYKMIITYVE
jgi:hypothetical protein